MRVVRKGRRRVPKHTYWLVQCACGLKKEVRADSLIDGSILSCGCYHSELLAQSGIHHAPGSRFGRLVVIREAGRRAGRGRLFECRCDCGRKVVVPGRHLRNGESTSCGCWYKQSRSLANLRHGQNHSPAHGGQTPVYAAFYRQRGWCRNPRDREYHRLGARGIRFLFDSFEQFFEALGPKPGPDYALMRSDPAGDFTADNLEWVETPQSRKRRRKRTLRHRRLTKLH